MRDHMETLATLAVMVAEDLFAVGIDLDEALVQMSAQIEAPLPEPCVVAVRDAWNRRKGDCCSGKGPGRK